MSFNVLWLWMMIHTYLSLPQEQELTSGISCGWLEIETRKCKFLENFCEFGVVCGGKDSFSWHLGSIIYIIDGIRSIIMKEIYANQCKNIWFESNQILPFLNQFQSIILPNQANFKIDSLYDLLRPQEWLKKSTWHLMFWFYIFYFN